MYICTKWNLEMYSVTKFHQTALSMNNGGVTCFCKKKKKIILCVSDIDLRSRPISSDVFNVG